MEFESEDLPIVNLRQNQGKIALTLAIHSAREGSITKSMQVAPTVTPHQIADTLVKAQGGVNATDITMLVDSRGRNLAEPQFWDQNIGNLGIKNGETLEVQGDIHQGLW